MCSSKANPRFQMECAWSLNLPLFFSLSLSTENTPSQWSSIPGAFCGGERQSPVDIITGHVETNNSLGSFRLVNFNSRNAVKSIVNTGHTGACMHTGGIATLCVCCDTCTPLKEKQKHTQKINLKKVSFAVKSASRLAVSKVQVGGGPGGGERGRPGWHLLRPAVPLPLGQHWTPPGLWAHGWWEKICNGGKASHPSWHLLRNSMTKRKWRSQIINKLREIPQRFFVGWSVCEYVGRVSGGSGACEKTAGKSQILSCVSLLTLHTGRIFLFFRMVFLMYWNQVWAPVYFLQPGVTSSYLIHLMFNSADARCQPEERAHCGAGEGWSGGIRRSGFLSKCKGVK